MLELNRGCEECHPAEADEWRGSLHQRSEIEQAYQRAFAIEPMPFCRGCHAPEADPRFSTPPALAALGVGCVSCHVDEHGAVLAVPGRARAVAPHAVVRDSRFATAGACAGCHEFAFPASSATGDGALLQATVSEHRNSNFADVACAACHMPLNRGRRRHDFTASRSSDVLRAALKAEARRLSETRIAVELQSIGVGHAFPTGDLFRRLEVSAEAVGPDQMSLAADTVWLKRHFEPRRGVSGQVLTRDDRLFNAPRTLELDVGSAAADHPIAWRVAYQRVAHPNGVDDGDAVLEDDIPLAWGLLPPLNDPETP